jgi:hypothetical protein
MAGRPAGGGRQVTDPNERAWGEQQKALALRARLNHQWPSGGGINTVDKCYGWNIVMHAAVQVGSPPQPPCSRLQTPH